MAKAVNKICAICGTTFRGRRDARTCSATCRKRLQRQNSLKARLLAEAKKLEQTAEQNIQQFTDSLLPKQPVLIPVGETAESQPISVEDSSVSEQIPVRSEISATAPPSLSALADQTLDTRQETVVSPQADKQSKRSFRRFAEAVVVALLLLTAGLGVNLALTRQNHNGLNGLSRSQQGQARQQRKQQLTFNSRTNQLQVKINALSTRIDNLKVGNNYYSTTGGSVSNGAGAGASNGQLSGPFNGPDELVQLTATGQLPVLDGSNLTNVNAITLGGNGAVYYTNASNLSGGTLNDARLSANVALLDGVNNFRPNSDSPTAFSIQNNAGTVTLFNVDTTGSGQVNFGVPASFGSTVSVGLLGVAGNTSLCLNTSAQIATCAGGGGSGVTSLDGLVGGLTIADSTPTTPGGTSITIDNASTTQKGLAQFNSGDFSDNGAGVISTIQPIATNSTPTFGGLTLNGSLTVSAGGASISGGANITGGLTSSGATTLTALGTGLVQSSSGGVLSSGAVDRNSGTFFTNGLSVANGGTGAGTFTANGILYGNTTGAVQATAAGATGQCLVGSTGAAPTWGSCGTNGVTTVGTIDSQTKNANGAVISGTDIFLQTADATDVGLVSATTQTFGGDKTFAGAVTVQGAGSFTASGTAVSVTNDASVGGNLGVTGTGTIGTLSVTGSATIGNGLTVTTGGITVTGNSTIAGTLTSLTGLTSTGTIQGGIVNATTGFQVNGTAASGNYLRGNGTNFVSGALQAADLTGTLFTLHASAGTDQNVGTGGTVSILAGSGNIITTASATNKVTIDVSSTPTFSGLTVSGLNAAGIVTNTSGGVLGTTSTVGVGNGGTGSATLAANGVLYGNGTGAIQATAVGATGQCLVGTTGAAPSWSTCSGLTSLQNAYVNGNTISTTGNDIGFTLNSSQNFTVTNAAGNTGFTTFALADGANPTTPAQLILVKNNDTNQAVATGISVQAAAGGITTAFDASGTNITNALAIGANAISGTHFSVTAAGAVTAVGVNSGSGQIQGSGGLNITGAASISGGLNNNAGGITNAGAISGATGFASSGTITLSGIGGAGVVQADSGGTLSSSNLNLASGPITGTLGVGNGGTGAASFTANGLLYGNGTSAIQQVAVGSSGQCLLGNTSAAPTWGTCVSGTLFTLQGTTGSSQTVTAGSTVSILAGSSGNITSAASPTNTITVDIISNPSFTGKVTASAGTTGLALTGAPVADAGTTSLLQLGSAISGGNSVTNGGTYIGINEPSGTAGSAADFLDFQNNGTKELQVTSAGVVTVQGGQSTDLATNAGNSLSLQPGSTSAGSGTGGALSLKAGNETGTSSTGGSVTLQGGSGVTLGGSVGIDAGTGTANGTISIGTANATTLTLGRSGGSTAINGATIADTAATSITNTVTGAVSETLNSIGDMIQNASSQNILQVDTVNDNLNVGSMPVTAPTLPSGGGTIGTQNPTTPASLGNTCGSAVIGASSVTYNGYIYEIGGNTSGIGGTTGTNTVCYAQPNVSTGAISTWNSTTSLGVTGGLYYATAVVYNGYIYVLGGTNGTSDQTAVYYAQINSNGTIGSWNTTTSLSTALEQATSDVVNGYIYEIAGVSGGTRQSTVSYAQLNGNGTIGSWHTTTSLSTVLASPGSVVNNGFIYVIGGSPTANTCGVGASAGVYYAPLYSNGTLGPWAATTSLTAQRFAPNVVTWGGYIYVLNGAFTGCGTGFSPTEYTAINSNGTLVSNSGNPWLLNSNITQVTEGTAVVLNGWAYSIAGSTSGTTATAGVNYLSLSGSQGTAGSGGQNVNLSVSGNAQIQTGVNNVLAFEVQNANSNNILGVDTLDSNVSVLGQLAVTGGISNAGLGVPAITSVTNSGSNNAASYTYAVSAVTNNGNYTAASATSSITTGPSSLTTGTPNVISWTGVPGAAKYYVYRTLVGGGGSPTSLGFIGPPVIANNNSSNSYSFSDPGIAATTTNGATASAPVAPTTDTSGQLTATGTALFENAANSTTAFQIQNSTGTTLFEADTTDSHIGIGTGSATPANLLSVGNLGAAVSAAQVAISTGATNHIGLVVQGANSQTADLFDAQTYNGSTASTVFSVGANGNLTVNGSGNGSTVAGSGALFQNTTDSTNAFEIQNHAATSNLFVADTTNSRIGIGLAPATAGATLQVSGVVSASGSLVIGGNTVCISTGCTGPGTGGSPSYVQNNSTGTAQTANYFIQSAGSGNVAATIEGASGNTVDLLDILNGSGTKVDSFDKNGSLSILTTSIAALTIQNTGGTKLFLADSFDLAITISGNATTAASLTLNDAYITSTQDTGLPTGTSLSGCGTAPTPTVTFTAGSTNEAGSFTVNEGSSPANSCTFTFNFVSPVFPSVPKSIIITPANALGVTAGGGVNATPSTGSSFVFTTAGKPNGTNAASPKYYYWVIE